LFPSEISEQQIYSFLLEHKFFSGLKQMLTFWKGCHWLCRSLHNRLPELAEISWKNRYHNRTIFSTTMLFPLQKIPVSWWDCTWSWYQPHPVKS